MNTPCPHRRTLNPHPPSDPRNLSRRRERRRREGGVQEAGGAEGVEGLQDAGGEPAIARPPKARVRSREKSEGGRPRTPGQEGEGVAPGLGREASGVEVAARLSGADEPPTSSASTGIGAVSPGSEAGPSDEKGSNVFNGSKGAAREDECVICWEVLSQSC